MRSLVFVLALFTALQVSAAGELTFRFIGNEAFEITDGTFTLLTDFPYRSGYSIYMDYPDEELRPRKHALCLITHRHGDHFEPSLFEKVGCSVLGPAEATGMLTGVVVLPLAETVAFGPLTVRPVRTPHRDLEHYSHGVEWHGLRLWLVGDTETTEHVPDDLDVLFVSPWLLSKLEAEGRQPARHTIVYHHTAEELATLECGNCRVPRQGESFTLTLPADRVGVQSCHRAR